METKMTDQHLKEALAKVTCFCINGQLVLVGSHPDARCTYSVEKEDYIAEVKDTKDDSVIAVVHNDIAVSPIHTLSNITEVLSLARFFWGLDETTFTVFDTLGCPWQIIEVPEWEDVVPGKPDNVDSIRLLNTNLKTEPNTLLSTYTDKVHLAFAGSSITLTLIEVDESDTIH